MPKFTYSKGNIRNENGVTVLAIVQVASTGQFRDQAGQMLADRLNASFRKKEAARKVAKILAEQGAQGAPAQDATRGDRDHLNSNESGDSLDRRS